MALNKVEICGVNTASLPVLAPEEKEELFERIKAGDKEARERYIKGNLRLVLSVIKRFQNSSENACTDHYGVIDPNQINIKTECEYQIALIEKKKPCRL